jgi:transposase
LELMVEPQAGIPVRLQPLRGNRRDAPDVGEAIRAHRQQVHTTDGLTSLVADRALSRAANLQQLAQTHLQWITRVPATVSAAQALLAQADPQRLASLTAGSRAQAFPAHDGGIEPRWVRIEAQGRQAQARRTADTQWRQQRDQAINAWQP